MNFHSQPSTRFRLNTLKYRSASFKYHARKQQSIDGYCFSRFLSTLQKWNLSGTGLFALVSAMIRATQIFVDFCAWCTVKIGYALSVLTVVQPQPSVDDRRASRPKSTPNAAKTDVRTVRHFRIRCLSDGRCLLSPKLVEPSLEKLVELYIGKSSETFADYLSILCRVPGVRRWLECGFSHLPWTIFFFPNEVLCFFWFFSVQTSLYKHVCNVRKSFVIKDYFRLYLAIMLAVKVDRHFWRRFISSASFIS